jgi:hypothetical protein
MTNLTALADRYADIKAEIEGLTRLLDEVKSEIKAAGREEIVGTRIFTKDREADAIAYAKFLVQVI